MSKLICHVHVGMPKTGTTSVQHTFSKAFGPPLIYLPFKNNNHSLLFATMFENAPWAHRRYKFLGHTREMVLRKKNRLAKELNSKLEDAVGNPGIDGVFFSGERLGLAGKTNQSSMERFRDFFAPWCSEFRIYGYVRPLASLLPSDFQQRIKAWGTAEVDIESIYPKYRARFEKFDLVFGRSNVSIRKFSKDTLLGGDVVLDLAKQLGVKIQDNSIQHNNESLNRDAVALLFAIRRSEHIPDQERKLALIDMKVARTLATIGGGGKLAFEASMISDLIKKQSADISWIENRINATVTDPAAANDRPIRHNRDLLEIAAEARQLLLDSDPDPNPGPHAVSAKQLLKWVDQGLEKG